jgi:anaerobic magnesium-protoporphyrin IX monomethyl ester cyclase
MRILFYARGVEQLGIEYIMSYLEKEGHVTELLFDPGLDNNLYYRLSALRFLNKWDRLIQKAVDWKPDLVAFSAVSNIFPFALEFCRRLKKYVDVPFVFGGVHATALPDYVLKHEEIDYVIRGEGEYVLEELATNLEDGADIKDIKNLCYKQNGKVFINPLRPLIQNLDELPFPRKDEFYREGAFRTQLHVITARGCLFKCTYCMNNFYKNRLYKEFQGRTPYVRRRTPSNVIEEIKLFVARYPINHIFFIDEIFIIDKIWLYELLERFKQEVRNVTFAFCYYHRFIDEDVAKRISEAGGNFAQGAIETADDQLRRNVLKRYETTEEILQAMEALRKYNIKTSTSAIFGIPHETSQSRWKTVELVEKSNPDMINSYLMYPFPGTEIVDMALREGYLSQEGWEKVKQGYSGYHQDSLFENLDVANAATMAKLLPLYIKGPRFLKPLVRRLMRMDIPRFAHFVYVVCVPFVYSGWAQGWVKNLLRIFYFNLFHKKERMSKAKF